MGLPHHKFASKVTFTMTYLSFQAAGRYIQVDHSMRNTRVYHILTYIVFPDDNK